MNVRLSQTQKIKVLNAEDVFNIMQQILLRENKIRRNQEHFWIVGLDHENKILFIELVSLGATNRVEVKPREVFRLAIYKLATKMILVHNHPTGNLSPSVQDKNFTDQLLKSGEMLGIEVLDHLIISEEGYFSFDDEAIMDELKKSGHYELVEREKASLREWKLKIEKERAAKNNALEIATKMKAKGYEIEVIKELTGLNKSEIDRL